MAETKDNTVAVDKVKLLEEIEDRIRTIGDVSQAAEMHRE